MKHTGRQSRWIPWLGCVLVVCSALPGAHAAQVDEAEASPLHLSDKPLAAVDASIARGVAWMTARIDERGVLRPIIRQEICPVALTAMGLWALAETARTDEDWAACQRAATYLCGMAQPDGGIYDPKQSLAIYTSGIAAQALRAYGTQRNDSAALERYRHADLFALRQGVPESVVDGEVLRGPRRDTSAARARALLADGKGLDADANRALRFLSGLRGDGTPAKPLRTRVPGASAPEAETNAPLAYDDVLRLVYLDLRPEHQVVIRALKAIRASYTLARNPDLTRRYGPDGFRPGTQGLYYYYLALARALSTFRRPVIALADGTSQDWVNDLALRLVRLQRPDGSWVNENRRWWEDEPLLVTTYALLALDLCRDVPRSREVRSGD